ncbi:hypothetical protein [Campylobacter lanienae]|uniref:hypothetical protein n=1 Tax=Campylobacter lanienae TaxID=75658 RepID=UPI003F09FED1
MKVVYTKTKLLNELNQICLNTLKDKSRMIVVITGLSGSGKSTLGKFIRKQGFGDFRPYQVCVIDDNVMSLNLFLIRPKIRYTPPPYNPLDNLKPFLKFLLPYIKIIFYIASNPNRISFADVLITLKIDENIRINQLNQREKDQDLKNTLINCKFNTNLPSSHHIYFMDTRV